MCIQITNDLPQFFQQSACWAVSQRLSPHLEERIKSIVYTLMLFMLKKCNTMNAFEERPFDIFSSFSLKHPFEKVNFFSELLRSEHSWPLRILGGMRPEAWPLLELKRYYMRLKRLYEVADLLPLGKWLLLQQDSVIMCADQKRSIQCRVPLWKLCYQSCWKNVFSQMINVSSAAQTICA